MKNIHIIKRNFEFQDIISESIVLKTESFILYIKKKSNFFKYGISVGKKIGIAVLRNKIKRQVRMMVYEILKSNLECKKNIIIIVKKTYLLKSYNENYEILKKGINKIK